MELEASKCPGGFEFLSNWALDPLRRASTKDVKLIDVSPAANESTAEPVVAEETVSGWSFFISNSFVVFYSSMLTRGL